MFRPVKRLAPSMLGLFGGGLGLLSYYTIMSPSLDLSACSCGWQTVEGITTWPVVMGSLIGLVGCAIAIVKQKAGGTFLLAGGIIAFSAIPYADPGVFFSPLLFFLAPSLFFGLLLILGGLLAFPRTRHLIKTLHNEGWIP